MVDMLRRSSSSHFADSRSWPSVTASWPGSSSALSQASPEEAYVHFVGVSPEERGTGLGDSLRALLRGGRGRGGRA